MSIDNGWMVLEPAFQLYRSLHPVCCFEGLATLKGFTQLMPTYEIFVHMMLRSHQMRSEHQVGGSA